jgi:hypothetical protein
MSGWSCYKQTSTNRNLQPPSDAGEMVWKIEGIPAEGSALWHRYVHNP